MADIAQAMVGIAAMAFTAFILWLVLR